MTPDLLRRALEILLRRHDHDDDFLDFPQVLVRLETLAEATPADQELAEAVRATHIAVTAGDGLPPILHGIRRERLVRWDGWTSTWDGVDIQTGAHARIRTLRSNTARDGMLRRALLRDGKAMVQAGWAVKSLDGDPPALVLPLAGMPLFDSVPRDLRTIVRMTGTVLSELQRLERLGIGLPKLSADELLRTEDGLSVVCLTPTADRSLQPRFRELGEAMLLWWGDDEPPEPMERVLQGWFAFPPETTDEATDNWRQALAEDLTATRHELDRRARQLRHENRRGRLVVALDALRQAVPPPRGRGAVGVDLEGRISVLTGHDGGLYWGAAGQPETCLFNPQDGLDVREARRLLRMRAASPQNQRLHAEVDGDTAFVDHACRWIAATTHSRSIRLLLDVEV